MLHENYENYFLQIAFPFSNSVIEEFIIGQERVNLKLGIKSYWMKFEIESYDFFSQIEKDKK